MINIETDNDLMNVLSDSVGYTLILKHSTRCPISSSALKEFESYVKTSQVETALILVVENRGVSNLLAEKISVRHESPQVILIKDGKPLWNVSHGAITKSAIDNAVQQHVE